MTDLRFNLNEFARRDDSVAAVVTPDALFGLLTRSVQLPPKWVGLVTREAGDQTVVSAGGAIAKDRWTELVAARTGPIPLAIKEDGLASSDSYQCAATVQLRVELIASRSELTAFRDRVMGSRTNVRTAQLMELFRPRVRDALREFVSRRPVRAIIGGEEREILLGLLMDAIKPLCFSAGLACEQDTPAIALSCPAYEEVLAIEESGNVDRKKREIDAELARMREEADNKRVEHVEAVLARFQKLVRDSSDASLPDLLKTFPEAQRGELYNALWRGVQPARRTQWIAVVAGAQALFFDPKNMEHPARRVDLAGDAGGLRSASWSVSFKGERTLLIGAAKGVYVLSEPEARVAGTYLWDSHPSTPRGGFNAVARLGDAIVGTHSEIGLVCWRDGGAELLLEDRTRDAKAVRGVRVEDGRVWLSIDDRVVAFDDAGNGVNNIVEFTGSGATITAFVRDSGRILAGNADGRLLEWKEDAPANPSVVHVGYNRAVESIQLHDWNGLRRLFYTDTSVAVYARLLDDAFVWRYEAGGQTIRRAEAAEDFVVGTNDQRDRLFVWSTARPDQPAGVIFVGRICGHSVQDMRLVPAPDIA